MTKHDSHLQPTTIAENTLDDGDDFECLGSHYAEKLDPFKPKNYTVHWNFAHKISEFAIQRNVKGDGHCFIYAIQKAILRFKPELSSQNSLVRDELELSQKGAIAFRRGLRQFGEQKMSSIINPENPLVVDTNDKPSRYIGYKNPDVFRRQLNRIFDPKVNYLKYGCLPREYWMESNFSSILVALKYGVSVFRYDHVQLADNTQVAPYQTGVFWLREDGKVQDFAFFRDFAKLVVPTENSIAIFYTNKGHFNEIEIKRDATLSRAPSLKILHGYSSPNNPHLILHDTICESKLDKMNATHDIERNKKDSDSQLDFNIRVSGRSCVQKAEPNEFEFDSLQELQSSSEISKAFTKSMDADGPHNKKAIDLNEEETHSAMRHGKRSLSYISEPTRVDEDGRIDHEKYIEEKAEQFEQLKQMCIFVKRMFLDGKRPALDHLLIRLPVIFDCTFTNIEKWAITGVCATYNEKAMNRRLEEICTFVESMFLNGKRPALHDLLISIPKTFNCKLSKKEEWAIIGVCKTYSE